MADYVLWLTGTPVRRISEVYPTEGRVSMRGGLWCCGRQCINGHWRLAGTAKQHSARIWSPGSKSNLAYNKELCTRTGLPLLSGYGLGHTGKVSWHWYYGQWSFDLWSNGRRSAHIEVFGPKAKVLWAKCLGFGQRRDQCQRSCPKRRSGSTGTLGPFGLLVA